MGVRGEKHLQDKSQQNLWVTPGDSDCEVREEEQRVKAGAVTLVTCFSYLFT